MFRCNSNFFLFDFFSKLCCCTIHLPYIKQIAWMLPIQCCTKLASIQFVTSKNLHLSRSIILLNPLTDSYFLNWINTAAKGIIRFNFDGCEFIRTSKPNPNQLKVSAYLDKKDLSPSLLSMQNMFHEPLLA